MGLFTKKIGPIFIKETSDCTEFIQKMSSLLNDVDGELKKKIEKQINLARYGEVGERNIAYELKNSGIDMYILHDIYLEFVEFSAQIDYIVVTRKRTYIIECKNLIGNIEIDNTGAFIRTYELFGKRIKEGIYSPITQNTRHLHVIKEIRKQSKSNFLTKMIFEKNFSDTYKSIVVLANPKTYLNAKYARKDIKEQVIRADQLAKYIREKDALVKDYDMNNEDMLSIAQFYLENNKSDRSDYAKKYIDLVNEIKNESQLKQQNGASPIDDTYMFGAYKAENSVKSIVEDIAQQTVQDINNISNNSYDDKVKMLKSYRLEQSRIEKIKPYYIFNDAQMQELLSKAPKDKKELLETSGFGNVKVEKYGDKILEIINM